MSKSVLTRLAQMERLNDKPDWLEIGERTNKFYEAAGVGIRYEHGIPVQRPELSRPLPNRDVNDFE